MTVQSKPPVSHRLLNLKTSLQSLPHQDLKAPNGYDIKHNLNRIAIKSWICSLFWFVKRFAFPFLFFVNYTRQLSDGLIALEANSAIFTLAHKKQRTWAKIHKICYMYYYHYIWFLELLFIQVKVLAQQLPHKIIPSMLLMIWISIWWQMPKNKANVCLVQVIGVVA